MKYNVGILTISDTASQDQAKDKSGPLLVELLHEFCEQGVLQVAHRTIVADNVNEIQHTIRRWTDEENPTHLVLCTGGTGFGVRDVTPEAIYPLINKQTPGLTHALTQFSLQQTPLAALSRLITGVRLHGSGKDSGSLIVALPGSTNAVQECCQVLLGSDGLLLHALELLNGGTGKEKHSQMQNAHHHQHNHHHHHHHGHHVPIPRTQQENDFKTHDPNQSVAKRRRISPYPIISLDEALKIILDTAKVNEEFELPTGANLRGYLLAKDVFAPRNLPPKSTSNVDGYAVNAKETLIGAYTVIKGSEKLSKGAVYRINTGQSLPEKTDAVVMVEDTDLLDEQDEEEKVIQIRAQVDVGENVRQAGSDVKKDQIVLSKGVQLSDIGGEIGTIAFLGLQKIQVIRKPKIAILSTGDELYDISKVENSKDAWGFRIFDANRPSLKAALNALGFDVIDLGISKDNVEQTLLLLQKGIEEADILITTGGTSMGESDLLKPLIERRLKDGKILFGRVAMKPGKPTTFATAKDSKEFEKLIFALPGNPASAMVCLFIFVLPALRRMMGFEKDKCHLPRVMMKIQNEMKIDPRPEFHRVIVQSKDGQLKAFSTGNQRSSGMHSMSTANGLVCVPALKEGGKVKLEKDSLAEVILLGNIVS